MYIVSTLYGGVEIATTIIDTQTVTAFGRIDMWSAQDAADVVWFVLKNTNHTETQYKLVHRFWHELYGRGKEGDGEFTMSDPDTVELRLEALAQLRESLKAELPAGLQNGAAILDALIEKREVVEWVWKMQKVNFAALSAEARGV